MFWKELVTTGGPWLIALAGILSAVVTWYNFRRSNDRADDLDPVSIVSQAIQATSTGLSGAITSLQSEVARMHEIIATMTAELSKTQNRLVDVQADLAVTRTENKRLQEEVTRLRGELSKFGIAEQQEN